MFVVDTNVLVYAINSDAPEHPRCRELLLRWRAQAGAWYVTWGICYEFLAVMTRRGLGSTPRTQGEAMGALRAILASPALEVLSQGDRHASVLHSIANDVPLISGNHWHDAETAALMREHGIRRIVTRDSDFHRFRFLEVVDPLVAEP